MDRSRISTYIINVPAKEQTASHLIHGYTGSFCTIASSQADLIMRNIDRVLTTEELYLSGFSSAQIDDLKSKGFLTDQTQQEEELFFSKIVSNVHSQQMKREILYAIIPSYECNFNCPYCFQKNMREMRGKEYLERRLSKEMVLSIFDAMEALEKEKGTVSDEPDSKTICLYGGEPFLARNREIIEFIVEEASNRFNPSFSAISNGYALEKFKDLLGPSKIQSVQVTLDGLPGIHNKRRALSASDRETFDTIVKNVTMALQRDVAINIRINVDSDNLPYLALLAEKIEEQGWHKFPSFTTTVAAVFTNPSDKGATSYYTSGELFQKVQELKEHHPALFPFMLQDEGYVKQLGSLIENNTSFLPMLKYNYCSASTSMYGFDPYGKVYACLEKVGMPDAAVGTYGAEGLIIDKDKMREWNGRTVLANETCRRCSYALFCGGGCACKAEQTHGSLASPFCDDFKTLFTESMAASFATAEQKRSCPSCS